MNDPPPKQTRAQEMDMMRLGSQLGEALWEVRKEGLHGPYRHPKGGWDVWDVEGQMKITVWGDRSSAEALAALLNKVEDLG